MKNVYLVFNDGKEEFLTSSFHFVGQARMGDTIVYKGTSYIVRKTVYDMDRFGLFIHLY